MSRICNDENCLNNPKNYNVDWDRDGSLTICDTCYADEIAQMSVDDLMEVHNVITTTLDYATSVDDILALPFFTDDIIDELMADDDIRRVAEAIKDKWTDRFNVLLQYKIRKDYG